VDRSCRRVRHDYGVVVVSKLGEAVVVVVVVVGDVVVDINFRRRAARVGATTGHTP
jgi:hypothetical protein